MNLENFSLPVVFMNGAGAFRVTMTEVSFPGGKKSKKEARHIEA
jgi:hypothetical protein